MDRPPRPAAVLAAAAVRAMPLLAVLIVVVAVAGARATAQVAGGEDRLLFGLMVAAPLGASIACLLRSHAPGAERRAWRMLSVCLLASSAASTVAGGAAVDPTATPELAAGLLLLITYGTGLRAFALLVVARLGRLAHTTWLDGLLGALVIQALLTFVLLMPSDAAIDGASASALLFPFADVLLVGLLLAAAAQGGWRLEGWTPLIAGVVLISVADCAFAARAFGVEADRYQLVMFALPLGHLCIGYAAWARAAVPEPFPAGRPGVPVTLGAIAAFLLALGALSDAPVAGVSAGLALLALIGVLARFGVTLSENEKLMRASQGQALSDALTGLPNRRRLESDLANAVAVATPASPAALGLFDLDGFKRYNDTFGHQAGDELLATVGARLAETVAPRATAYRLGGDEFCVLLPDSGDDADGFMATAAAALASDITGFPVAPSYGTAIVPVEATSVAAALKLADQRMYGHKASKPDRPGHGAAVAGPSRG